MATTNKTYWWVDEKIRSLCIEWQRTDDKYRHKIYLKLRPFFRKLSEQICNSMSYSTIRRNEMINDLVDACFLKIESYNVEHKTFTHFYFAIKTEIGKQTYLYLNKYHSHIDFDEFDESNGNNYVNKNQNENQDYKKILIDYLENYQFKNKRFNTKNNRNVILEIINFINNHEKYEFYDIMLYLLANKYLLINVRQVFHDVFHREIWQIKDRKDDYNHSTIDVDENYYNELLKINKKHINK